MTQVQPTCDMHIKLLMLGDSGVGKTCLFLRYCNDSFSPSMTSTIGIDFNNKKINLDGKNVKLQVWDTAGAERFRTMTAAYYRGAHGIVLVYDVTDRRTFQSIRNWVYQIHQHVDVHVIKMLVGNKCDMLDERVVNTHEGEKLAREFNMGFWETSAKNNLNVEESFHSIAKRVKDRIIIDGGGTDSTRGKIKLNTVSQALGRGNCC